MKWGVIATGGIAQAVTADMLKVEGVTVLAVSSRDVTRAQAFAERFGINRAYGDYRELLRDEDVEIVYVATPHSQHHEVTLAALDAGKHVLCEKPIGISSAQVVDMIVKARTEKRFLMEAMWTRFNPLILHREQRVLRRHMPLLEFAIHAAAGWQKWMPRGDDREAHRRAAIARWYGSHA